MSKNIDESTEVAALPTNDSFEQGDESPLDSLYEYKEPKQVKSFPFWVKGIEDGEEDSMVTIKGYGAVFGNVDLGNDVILRNAFSKTLSDKGNKVYFLADHKYNLDNFLGIAEVEEDNIGLFGEYKMDLRREVARDAYLAAKQAQDAGLPMGMSIGFDIIDQEMDAKSQVRMLKEIRLHEISLTMFPMNQEARVVEAKSVKELVELSTKDSLQKEKPSADTSVDEAETVQLIENLTKSIQNERD